MFVLIWLQMSGKPYKGSNFLDNFSVCWIFRFPSPIVNNKWIYSFKTFFSLGLGSRSRIPRSKDVNILSNKLPFRRRILVSN